MNNIALIGRTVGEPQLKYIPNTGKACCNFTLAVDKGLSKEMKADFESKGKPTADFINVVVWGKLAEVVANYVGKGKQMGVNGKLEINLYEKDGQKKSFAQVVAYNVDILEWKNSGEKKPAKVDDPEDEFSGIDEDDIFEPTDDDMDSEIPF